MGRLGLVLSTFALLMSAQSTSVSAQDVETGLARPIGNIAEWFPQSSMPAESVVRRQVGAVVAQLRIDAGGTVTDCRVVKSSGYSLLDAAACNRAKSVGRFEPARDGTGNRVASTFTLPELRYVLSKENLSVATVDAKRTVFNSTIQVDIDKAGIIQKCRSLNADTSDKEACGAYVVGQPAPPAFKASSGSTVTVSNTIVVDQNIQR
jgi:TonB family protein